MRVAAYLFGFLIPLSSGKIYDKCELAVELKTKYQMSQEEVKNWVCIAEYESTFNTEAINPTNWDGSKDYGLFQINNRYWCGDDFGKSECGVACERFLDDDLEDDLKCAKKIVRDTERWTKKPNGLVAWVAYVRKCQTQNLDTYIKECSDALATPPMNVTKESPESVTMAPEIKPTIPPRGSGLGFLTGPVRQETSDPSPFSSPAATSQMQQPGSQEAQAETVVKNTPPSSSFEDPPSTFGNVEDVLGRPKHLFTVLFLTSRPTVNFLESIQEQRPDSTESLIRYTLPLPYNSLVLNNPGYVTYQDLKSQIIPLRVPVSGGSSPPPIRPLASPYFQNQPVRIPPYPGLPISSQPLRMEYLSPGDPRLIFGPFGIANRIPNNIIPYPFLTPHFRDVDAPTQNPTKMPWSPGRLPLLTTQD